LEAPEFQFRIAKSHFFLWHFADAIQAYETLIKSYPQTPWAEKASYEIGVTYFTRGEQHAGRGGLASMSLARDSDVYQEAIDAYEKFLKKYPNSELAPQARFGIAACLEEMDQLDAAFHAYEALRASYPSPKVIEIKLARIRERKAQRSR
jgi:TolA-binding protein